MTHFSQFSLFLGIIHKKAAAFENYLSASLYGISFWILEVSLAGEKQIPLPKMFWKELESVISFTALHWPLLITDAFYSWSGEFSSESLLFKRTIKI